jgi:hypothetical protein
MGALVHWQPRSRVHEAIVVCGPQICGVPMQVAPSHAQPCSIAQLNWSRPAEQGIGVPLQYPMLVSTQPGQQPRVHVPSAAAVAQH